MISEYFLSLFIRGTLLDSWQYGPYSNEHYIRNQNVLKLKEQAKALQESLNSLRIILERNLYFNVVSYNFLNYALLLFFIFLYFGYNITRVPKRN